MLPILHKFAVEVAETDLVDSAQYSDSGSGRYGLKGMNKEFVSDFMTLVLNEVCLKLYQMSVCYKKIQDKQSTFPCLYFCSHRLLGRDLPSLSTILCQPMR